MNRNMKAEITWFKFCLCRALPVSAVAWDSSRTVVVIKLRRTSALVATTDENIGNVLESEGKFDEALKKHQKCLETQERVRMTPM